MITMKELEKAVSPKNRKYITEDMVETLNRIQDPDFREHYKQNMVSMASILADGTYTTKDFTNAVKFVSYKLLEETDIDAYMMTFPDRYERLMSKWLAEGMTEEEVRERKISSFVAAYKRNDLVAKVFERTLVPSRILNAPLFQEALNVQVQLMYSSRSDIVKQQAAKTVMEYTHTPEAVKIEMEIGMKEDDEIKALRDEMAKLAAMQLEKIESKVLTSKDVAHTKLLHEPIDVEVDDD